MATKRSTEEVINNQSLPTSPHPLRPPIPVPISLWEPPYAEEEGGEGELVNGRRLRAGWRKVGPDDDGDIWYENAAGESLWEPPYEGEDDE